MENKLESQLNAYSVKTKIKSKENEKKDEMEKSKLESALKSTQDELAQMQREETTRERAEKVDRANEDSVSGRANERRAPAAQPETQNSPMAGQLVKVEKELVSMQKKEEKERIQVEEEEAQKFDIGLVALAIAVFAGLMHVIRSHATSYPAEAGIIKAWQKGAYVPVVMEMDDEEDGGRPRPNQKGGRLSV